VLARQHGRPIFALTANFQQAEEGWDHQDVMPEVTSPADSLDPRALLAEAYPDRDASGDSEWDVADLRYVGSSGDGLLPLEPEHPALQRLRNTVVHSTDDENVLVFSKHAGDDTVITVVNLDPHGTRETTVHLDLPAMGRDWGDTFAVHDEITGQEWSWGQHNYVRLDPGYEPAHILTVRSDA
jgi:hypothetical protein